PGPGTGMGDQGRSHRERSVREDMRAVLPGDIVAEQADEGSVDDGGRLQGAAAATTPQARRSHPAQRSIDLLQQAIARIGVATPPSVEQPGQILAHTRSGYLQWSMAPRGWIITPAPGGPAAQLAPGLWKPPAR